MFAEKWFSEPVKALTRRPSFLRQRINLIDRILAPTRLMRSILINNGVRPEKIDLCPYGINLKHTLRVERVPGQVFRIGFIGTLYEHKGVHLLVEAVRSLPPNLPLELKIYGRVDEFPDYVERIRALAGDDPRIQFCGTFPNEQIGEVFSRLDALVVPSIWYENTPLVMYSAQASGCPLIASNLGGMAEVIHNDMNGFLLEPGDVSGLAGVLQKICPDRSILPRLAARAIMPKSSTQYAADVDGVYQQLLPRPASQTALGSN